VVLASLGAAGWLVVSGQAGSVDGLFLTLTCLLVATAFGLYMAFVVRRAMEALRPPEPKAAAKAAGAAKAKVEPAEQAV
jgi:hypothetical protein